MAEPKGKVTNIEDGKKPVKGLAPLPPMPRARKTKPPKPCACGCGEMTKGGNYITGHDSYVKGWAIRVERGIVKLADVPDPQRNAVKKILLDRKKAAAEKTATASTGGESADTDTESES